MIILDDPYVSPLLYTTIARLNLPVLRNPMAESFSWTPMYPLLDESAFVDRYRGKLSSNKLYCVSENSIAWVLQHLAFTDLPRQISTFKNKYHFRQLLHQIYPTYYFRRLTITELTMFDIESAPLPCVLKPTVGFFSIAVFLIREKADWTRALDKIQEEIARYSHFFPHEVLDLSSFLLEQYIEGEEYALDLYFDDRGIVRILNLMHHLFAGPQDTSDRMYITSKEIIDAYLPFFAHHLQQIGDLVRLRNFPMHLECRVNAQQELGIIEVNPMRFAGLCVTDLSYFAFGNNNYDLFFSNRSPDWDNCLPGHEGRIYAMVLGNIPSHIAISHLSHVNYNAYRALFSHILDLREMNWRKFPLFAITFAQFDSSTLAEWHFHLHTDYASILH